MNSIVKQQHVRTPYLEGWGQVSLERLADQALRGLRIEGPGHSKTVALTFDDGPSRYSREILRILARHRVKATFFFQGKAVEKMPAMARETLARGHCFGNHTYNHQRAERFSDYKLLMNQLRKTDNIFRKVLKRGSKLYRPAYGAISDRQLRKVQQLGYQCFSWSIDTQDWYFRRPEDVRDAVARYLHPEAVILMHDMGFRRSVPLRAVDMVIRECRRQGYTFVTLDKYVARA